MKLLKTFNLLTLRQKIFLILLIVIGVFFIVWGVITGRLRIGADTLGGSISGYTYDEFGEVLADVHISVQGKYTINGDDVNTNSNSLGYYFLGGLRENAVVSFSKDGLEYPVSFSDIPPDYWARKYIGALIKSGITSGYPDGTYGPEIIVTRDQMAVFISRVIAGGDSNVPSGPSSPSFSDVPTSHWAYKYIEFLSRTGIVSGYPDGTYGPRLEVDRAQMAVFMSRAAGIEPYDNQTPTFTDVPRDHWAYQYVETCFLNGIVSGYSVTEFKPSEKVNRAQMAVFLMRAFQNYPLTNGGYSVRRGVYSVKPGESETYDIYLEKQEKICDQGVSFNGRVFSNQKKGPLLGIRAFIDKSNLPAPYNDVEQTYESSSDSAGYFEIGCLPKGQSVTLNLVADYLTSKTVTVNLPTITGGKKSIGIVFFYDDQTEAIVTATATDSDGSPLAGAYVILSKEGKKYSSRIAANGSVSIETPPGIYNLSIEKALLDKIIYYRIPLGKGFVALRPGAHQVLDLTGLSIEKEESY